MLAEPEQPVRHMAELRLAAVDVVFVEDVEAACRPRASEVVSRLDTRRGSTVKKSVKSEAAAKVIRLASELSHALDAATRVGVTTDVGVDEVRLTSGQTIKQVRAYILSLGE